MTDDKTDVPFAPPFQDRITAADQARYRTEYEAAAAARRAMLALAAPFWMRLLAMLPNPKKPLADWIAANKARLSNRL